MNRSNLVAVIVGVLMTTSVRAQVTPSKGTGDSDKLEASAEQIARMKTGLKQVLGRVDEARNEKDIVKMNCVNEKLTQIKVLIRVAEQADVALHEAVANHDPGAEAEFAKIAISRSKVDMLRSESEQCIGQLAYMVDEKTNVVVEQPDNLPGSRDMLALGVARRTSGTYEPGTPMYEVGSPMTGTESVLPRDGGPGFGPERRPDFPPPPPPRRPCPASPYLGTCAGPPGW